MGRGWKNAVLGPIYRSLARSVGLPSSLLGKLEGKIIPWPQAAVLAVLGGGKYSPKPPLSHPFLLELEDAVGGRDTSAKLCYITR